MCAVISDDRVSFVPFYHLSMLRSFSNVSLPDADVHRKISLTFPTVQEPSGALITRLTFIFPLN